MYVALTKLNVSGTKFSFGVSKNIHKLKPTVVSLEEAKSHKENYKAYDKERIELLEKHSKKENGKPKIVNNEYILEDENAFELDHKELEAKHSEALKERKKQEEEYNELLEETTEIELYKIKLSDVPESITTLQMNSIFDIIEE